MILNTSKIKTEALLLFCKDIILSYQEANQDLFDINSEVKEFIQKNTQEILRELNKVTKPNDFYWAKREHAYVKAVLRSYEYLNKTLNQQLEKGKPLTLRCFVFHFLHLGLPSYKKSLAVKSTSILFYIPMLWCTINYC